MITEVSANCLADGIKITVDVFENVFYVSDDGFIRNVAISIVVS